MDVEEPGAIEVVTSGVLQVTSFGTDAEGRLYVTSLDGSVWRLMER